MLVVFEDILVHHEILHILKVLQLAQRQILIIILTVLSGTHTRQND